MFIPFGAILFFLFYAAVLVRKSDRRKTYAYWQGCGRRRTDDNPAHDQD